MRLPAATVAVRKMPSHKVDRHMPRQMHHQDHSVLSLKPTRQSAGICEPDPSRTRSPGTRRVASMLCHLPSLHTVACGLSDAFRALTASPALVVSYLQQAQNTARLHGRLACFHLPGSYTVTAPSAPTSPQQLPCTKRCCLCFSKAMHGHLAASSHCRRSRSSESSADPECQRLAWSAGGFKLAAVPTNAGVDELDQQQYDHVQPVGDGSFHNDCQPDHDGHGHHKLHTGKGQVSF